MNHFVFRSLQFSQSASAAITSLSSATSSHRTTWHRCWPVSVQSAHWTSRPITTTASCTIKYLQNYKFINLVSTRPLLLHRHHLLLLLHDPSDWNDNGIAHQDRCAKHHQRRGREENGHWIMSIKCKWNLKLTKI